MTTTPFTPPASPRQSVQLNDAARLAPSSPFVQTRPLSDNELSYFLPSRAIGVNDMYLHHHLTTPSPELFNETRIATIWAILRARHPLLASEVIKQGDWSFRYDPPTNANEAINEAFDALSCPRDNLTGEDLIDSYLNGPRLLSPSRLSFLVVSQAACNPSNPAEFDFDFLLCTTHFVGDGIALHTLANEFYSLVANGGTQIDLRHLLVEEMHARSVAQVFPFPRSTEELMATASAEANEGSTKPALVRAASKVALARSQRRAVGSQTFARLKGSKTTVRTVVPTGAYPVEETKRILARCKKEGLSVSNAVFGLVGVAWGRVLLDEAAKGNVLEPMLLYSALSLRSYLPKPVPTAPIQSYFHLSLGYYTVTFPSFLPSSSSATEQTFWTRSRSSKTQTITHLKSKLLMGKATAEAEERRVKAVRWAEEDDRVAAKAAEMPKEMGLVGLGFMGLDIKEGSVVEESPRVPSTPPSMKRGGRAMSPVDVFRARAAAGLPDTPPSTPGRIYGSPEVPKRVLGTATAPLTPPQDASPKFVSSTPTPFPVPTAAVKAPATSPLLGLSLLGNLDAIYQHASYGSAFKLTALTTGSRQRQGGILLFAYTFVGKLWLSLGWDEQGFTEEGKKQIEGMWEGIQGGVGEFLLA